MKIRSKALYAYLLERGVLSASAEVIALAKADYRKEYKKRWKQQIRPRKEIRIGVSLKQYHAIKAKALKLHLKTTTYSRAVLIASTSTTPAIGTETLYKVLQLVSMATTKTMHNEPSATFSTYLEQAETLLLDFIALSQ